jgi:hypothetical protein
MPAQRRFPPPNGRVIDLDQIAVFENRLGFSPHDKKEAPLPGLRKENSPDNNLAVLLAGLLLPTALLAALAGLLVRLLLLLAGLLLPTAALLLTLAALLVLLIFLVRHEICSLRY